MNCTELQYVCKEVQFSSVALHGLYKANELQSSVRFISVHVVLSVRAL